MTDRVFRWDNSELPLINLAGLGSRSFWLPEPRDTLLLLSVLDRYLPRNKVREVFDTTALMIYAQQDVPEEK